MEVFRSRYWGYENFKDMFMKVRKYTFGKVFEYNTNKPIQIINKTNILLGGNIEEIVEKYKDIVNIQIDKISSSEIELMIVNINSQITCGIIILDKEKKIATIHDLLSDITCLKKQVTGSVISQIIKIIIKISKKMGMEYINLSDTSTHTCKGTQTSFKLNIANTLTSGEPYYYKYGFRYVDKENDQIVRSNREIITGLKTMNINIEEILMMMDYVLKKRRKTEEYIESKKEKIKLLYKKMLNESINKFMNKLKYSECELFSYIYMDLAIMLNLGLMSSNKLMYYKL